MDLKERLQEDLRAALRARDERRKSVIRLSLAAITNAEIEKGELDDAGFVAILQNQANRRRAGLVGGFPIPATIKVLSWATTVFMALNTLANLGSVSKAEKVIFTPITFLLMVSCFLVSISRPEA